ADEPDAGRRAALDLMQHAGPRAIGENGVLAGANLEYLLERRDAVAYRTGARERSEVLVLAVERAAMKAKLRKGIAGKAHVRIALVVAEEDVVARLERLDEVVLEQQRLAVGAYGGGLDARDLRNHRRDARLVLALLEIA